MSDVIDGYPKMHTKSAPRDKLIIWDFRAIVIVSRGGKSNLTQNYIYLCI